MTLLHLKRHEVGGQEPRHEVSSSGRNYVPRKYPATLREVSLLESEYYQHTPHFLLNTDLFSL